MFFCRKSRQTSQTVFLGQHHVENYQIEVFRQSSDNPASPSVALVT
jgi:hypothetical protein